MLRTIKGSGDVKAVSDDIVGLSKTRDGDLLVRLKSKNQTTGKIIEAIGTAMGDKAAVRELAHIQKIVVQDLDEQAVPSEIVGAIEGITGAKTEEIRVISTWDLSRGQKWAIISLPAHFASKLLTAGRLRVGYTNCRVRFWEERRRGRCPKCTEPDRRNCCRVCGANGLYESSCETSEEAKAIFKAELAQQQIGGGSGNKQPKEHAGKPTDARRSTADGMAVIQEATQ